MFHTLHALVTRRVAIPIANRLVAHGVTANQVTAAGLAVCLMAAAAICANGPLALAGILFLIGSFGDLIDGSIAPADGHSRSGTPYAVSVVHELGVSCPIGVRCSGS